MKREFSPYTFSKNAETPNFMKFHPVGAELFYTDRRTRTEGRTEMTKRNSHFSQFWESA